ncbi:MAG: hypothetical protein JOZ18_12885 [Chloroflexi bacterium]|nr:hypothetical protein [Chloroflexota bacterium]
MQQQKQQMKHLLDYELSEGERLLWSDQPNALHVLNAGHIISFIFGSLWVCLGLLGLYNNLLLFPSDPLFVITMTILALLFLIPGIISIAVPFKTYRRAKRTIYAITDRRIVLITRGRSRSVKSYRKEYVGNIERIERQGERGDLIFGINKDIKFSDVANVRHVEQLLLHRPG